MAWGWQNIFYSALLFLASLVSVFWLSVFLYATFYFTYLPHESMFWPIHFSHSSCPSRPGLCSIPSAIIRAKDEIRGSRFARGQRYQIVVELEMPESPTNRNLGMFSVILTAKNEHNHTIESVSRSAMMKYKSSLLQTISTLMFSPFMLWGVKEEKQVVLIIMLTDFFEDPLNTVQSIIIEVDSMFIEIYSGWLRVYAKFSGLRYFMHTYPYLTAFVGIMVSMTFFVAILLFSWYQFSPSLDATSATRTNLSDEVKNEKKLSRYKEKHLEAEIENLPIERATTRKALHVSSNKEKEVKDFQNLLQDKRIPSNENLNKFSMENADVNDPPRGVESEDIPQAISDHNMMDSELPIRGQ